LRERASLEKPIAVDVQSSLYEINESEQEEGEGRLQGIAQYLPRWTEQPHTADVARHTPWPPGNILVLTSSSSRRNARNRTSVPTSKAQVAKRLLVTPQMIVNPEALVVGAQSTQLTQERQIFSRILHVFSKVGMSLDAGWSHLLCVLSDH
jgi:hypothetical protein